MSNTATAEIFRSLPGTWRLYRDVPGQGHIIGTVTFTPVGDEVLHYEETGRFHLENGTSTEATRSYIYELQDDKIIIRYNDPARQGDILHELEFIPENGGFRSQHCHVCAADTYDLVFRFSADRRIEMSYEVHGPKKDYSMQSVLTRAASGPS